MSQAVRARRCDGVAPPPVCAEAPPHRQQQTNAVNNNSLPRLSIIIYASLAAGIQAQAPGLESVL
jgi:hypothetical protein